MHRLRISLAAMVAVIGLSAFGLAAPQLTMACSCIAPMPIADYKDQADTYILEGTVTEMGPNKLGTFRIEKWYQGSGDVEDVPIRAGDGADCGIPLAAGQQLVMVAFLADGVLSPNICSPYGDLSTAEGQTLQADVVTAFGEGAAPGGETDPPTGGEAPTGGESPTSGTGIPGIVYLLGGGALALIVIVGAASLLASRRGS